MTRKRKRRRGKRLLLLLLALLAFRLWLDNFTVCLRAYELRSPALPPGFEGLRVAQITDLHGCERLYDGVLRRTREAKPDLIALTGDLTDAEDQWPALEPLLQELTEIAPCFYVSGNHEWADLEPEPLFRRIAAAGVRVLRNEWVLLERGGDRLALVGFEDPNGYADMITPGALCEAVRAETGACILALCHRPGQFPALAEGGCSLVLSGHLHGGLIRLPVLGGLVSPGGWLPDWDKGIFTLGDSVMLVSPGLGGSGGVPRFLNRPEVSVAVLGK